MSIYHEGDILEGIDGFYIVKQFDRKYRACKECVFHSTKKLGCSFTRHKYLNRKESCDRLIGSVNNHGICFIKLEGGL